MRWCGREGRVDVGGGAAGRARQRFLRAKHAVRSRSRCWARDGNSRTLQDDSSLMQRGRAGQRASQALADFKVTRGRNPTRRCYARWTHAGAKARQSERSNGRLTPKAHFFWYLLRRRMPNNRPTIKISRAPPHLSTSRAGGWARIGKGRRTVPRAPRSQQSTDRARPSAEVAQTRPARI